MTKFVIQRKAGDDYEVRLDDEHMGYYVSFRAAMLFICVRKQVAFPKSMGFTIEYVP